MKPTIKDLPEVTNLNEVAEVWCFDSVASLLPEDVKFVVLTKNGTHKQCSVSKLRELKDKEE